MGRFRSCYDLVTLENQPHLVYELSLFIVDIYLNSLTYSQPLIPQAAIGIEGVWPIGISLVLVVCQTDEECTCVVWDRFWGNMESWVFEVLLGDVCRRVDSPALGRSAALLFR